ncbi:hypothetical protein H257_09319 [Aphanomyces astaci]|uniref:Uncharacterized protein n=1 Tax=Aphanomyces astaci TaxID=112090 RepID=W4GC64_APHAT|nr:hypothetical protein H257_09319 [Aphanomyces astaci]ETV76881.1 hypothetical protein H257_09319 [Aphanomyces astaci]|eukprot:XP_009833793.1 hypothetical protein H257_09319 [Aphanomyces astaci]
MPTNGAKDDAVPGVLHLEYGMTLVQTVANGVQTCRCLCCVHEGCDVVEVGGVSGRKRKSRSDIM